MNVKAFPKIKGGGGTHYFRKIEVHKSEMINQIPPNQARSIFRQS
jgi:hypothetical protein